MTREPRDLRYANKQTHIIRLYEDELEMLQRLVDSEIVDLNNRLEEIRAVLRPREKILRAYQEMVDDYNELLEVLSNPTTSQS